MKKIGINNLISLISFLIFISIGVFMYLDHINKNNVDEDIELRNKYYFDFDKNKENLNAIGLLNKKNTEYILNATNTEYRTKILNLINDYRKDELGNLYLDNRESFEKILKDSKAHFYGDSNVEHFSFYDALDKNLYTFMTGKSIKKQKDLIIEKIDKDVKNIIIFNGYNLEDFKSGEEYVEAYENLISNISLNFTDDDIKIYICSLLPAEIQHIIDDYKLPLSHNIYRGIEFDKALENHNFEDGIYIDTKWIPKNGYHTSDGVHMIKDFYYVLIPYVAYFINLYD